MDTMQNEPNDDSLREEYKKTIKREITKKIGSMTLLVSEDTYDKALTAFNIGVAGIEMGMDVSMFFTARGVNIMKKAYRPRRARFGEAPIAWKENLIQKRGGAVLAQLMYQAKDMGVHLCVCYTSLASTNLKESMLLDGIKVMRMVEFLELTLHSDVNLVIG